MDAYTDEEKRFIGRDASELKQALGSAYPWAWARSSTLEDILIAIERSQALFIVDRDFPRLRLVEGPRTLGSP